MRCHICDKALTEAEIQLTPDGEGFEPCAHCMEVALDAAYCDGFVRPDDLDGVEILDNDVQLTDVDQLEFQFQEDTYD